MTRPFRARFAVLVPPLAILLGLTFRPVRGEEPPPAPTPAETSAPNDADFTQWLKDLDADDFALRTSAEKKLVEAGAAANAVVEAEARKKDHSPEKKTALKRILDALESAVEWKRLSNLPRRSLDLSNTTAGHAAKKLASAYGIRIEAWDPAAERRYVNVQIENATWAEAVAAVCRKAGLEIGSQDACRGAIFLMEANYGTPVFSATGGFLYQLRCRRRGRGMPNVIYFYITGFAPSGLYFSGECSVNELTMVDAGGQRHAAFDKEAWKQAHDDGVSHPALNEQLHVSAKAVEAVGNGLFALECNIGVNWPGALRRAEFRVPPPADEILASEVGARRLAFRYEKTPRGVRLDWHEELTFKIGETAPAAGWLLALDGEGQPVRASGSSSTAISEGDDVALRTRDYNWSLTREPARLVLVFSDTATLLKQAVRFEGVRVPQDEKAPASSPPAEPDSEIPVISIPPPPPEAPQE